MPRLDNTDNLVIKEFELSFNPDDPGETPPVDLCYKCWIIWEGLVETIDHPPYEDCNYTCTECGCELTKDDNEHYFYKNHYSIYGC